MMAKVNRKPKKDLKYEMQTRKIGQRELEMTQEALCLLRNHKYLVLDCYLRRKRGGKGID